MTKKSHEHTNLYTYTDIVDRREKKKVVTNIGSIVINFCLFSIKWLRKEQTTLLITWQIRHKKANESAETEAKAKTLMWNGATKKKANVKFFTFFYNSRNDFSARKQRWLANEAKEWIKNCSFLIFLYVCFRINFFFLSPGVCKTLTVRV